MAVPFVVSGIKHFKKYHQHLDLHAQRVDMSSAETGIGMNT